MFEPLAKGNWPLAGHLTKFGLIKFGSSHCDFLPALGSRVTLESLVTIPTSHPASVTCGQKRPNSGSQALAGHEN